MMEQLSTFPGPPNLRDHDSSSSTQSTGQSCPEVTSEGERKIHGRRNTPLHAGSFRSTGKSDGSQSVSSPEHGWSSNTNQRNFAPFPHPNPYHHGMVAAYGTQTMVQPQMLGVVSPRVPLPLELQQDEPIFVNAKQYQAILRRRQYRAKLEAQNKLSKGRKPYLHESRHRHALNRARGPSGRFVNMKNLRESKSPDESQPNTEMLQTDGHYNGNYTAPSYTFMTSGLNNDAIPHQQPLNYSAFHRV